MKDIFREFQGCVLQKGQSEAELNVGILFDLPTTPNQIYNIILQLFGRGLQRFQYCIYKIQIENSFYFDPAQPFLYWLNSQYAIGTVLRITFFPCRIIAGFFNAFKNNLILHIILLAPIGALYVTMRCNRGFNKKVKGKTVSY